MRILSDDEIQKIFDEVDYKKSLRGRLSKLCSDFVKSLNPKYVKEQRTKRHEEREQYKAEIKAQYGMSDTEIEKAFKQVEYYNSRRYKISEKLHIFGQRIKLHNVKKQPERLTDADIQTLLDAISNKEDTDTSREI